MERIDTEIGTFYVDRESDSNNLFTLLDENKKYICKFGDSTIYNKEEKVEDLRNINDISELVDLEIASDIDEGKTPIKCYESLCKKMAEYGVDCKERFPFEEAEKDYICKVGNTYFMAEECY